MDSITGNPDAINTVLHTQRSTKQAVNLKRTRTKVMASFMMMKQLGYAESLCCRRGSTQPTPCMFLGYSKLHRAGNDAVIAVKKTDVENCRQSIKTNNNTRKVVVEH